MAGHLHIAEDGDDSGTGRIKDSHIQVFEYGKVSGTDDEENGHRHTVEDCSNEEICRYGSFMVAEQVTVHGTCSGEEPDKGRKYEPNAKEGGSPGDRSKRDESVMQKGTRKILPDEQSQVTGKELESEEERNKSIADGVSSPNIRSAANKAERVKTENHK